MASFVKAADAITAAVEIERRGHAFYLQAQKQSASAEANDFFGFMADEERKHEKIFEAMLERIGGLELPAGSNENEYLDYVKATLDSHMLFLPEADIKGQNPYSLAIRFEKDTILYFLAILDLVPENEKPLVMKCIDEEKSHIRLIVKKRYRANT